ncbi:hypothetical protein [Azotobacter beijerinckii]|uniref:Uncharacterized protein n=1 Tax=Azotobacter beijerinckii TaxID=170623 RepID=A0A1I4GBD9_9GAMM|nr:hypothetical protein [Azotobacter beijerinckii]SFL26830.1 hypothetical protein SAMN04244574_03744 [Azotobacter beijerinckii]
MTGNAETKSPEAIRQERHRAKLEALGVKEVATQLGPREREMLEELRTVRGGLRGPYSIAEYLAESIRRDHALLLQELVRLERRICTGCRKPLPRGCGGLWANETSICLRAQADRAMEL